MAISIVSSTSSQSTTQSFTISSASSILVVPLAYRNTGSITGITYNGVALTQAVSRAQGSGTTQAHSEIWYLLTPSTGTHDIVVTTGPDVTDPTFGAIEVAGAMQGSIGGTSSNGATNNGTGYPRTTTLTVQGFNGIVIDAIRAGAYTYPITKDGTQTQVFNYDTGSGSNGSSYKLHSGSNVTMTWTDGTIANTEWAIVALELKEIATFSILDTATISETPVATKGKVFTLLETITLSDVVSGIRGAIVTILETLSLSDSFSLLERWPRQTKHTATLTNQTKHESEPL